LTKSTAFISCSSIKIKPLIYKQIVITGKDLADYFWYTRIGYAREWD
jgi:hypothetical protein